jgi:hypothetical protein
VSYADHPHKNGRPRRAAAVSQHKTVRFTPDEIAALEMHAQRASERLKRAVSVSEVMRAGLAQLGLFSARRVALDL